MNYSQGQYAQSQYVPKDQYGGYQAGGASNFDAKQSQFRGSDIEIKALFDAFQKNQRVDLNEFRNTLEITGVSKKCSILEAKIGEYLQKNRNPEVDFNGFSRLFEFDLRQESDFRFTFEAIDTSKSGSISIAELEKASQVYDLNLKKDDMKLMIENLKSSNPTSVTILELYNALYNQ